MSSVTYIFSPNTVIASAKVNQNFADAIAGNVPIGGIISYWSDGGAAPDNYAFCDGTVINNSSSILNGKTTPNIMDSKFVRGVANSDLRATPSNGGADSINLQHSHTVNSHTHTGPSHTHSLPAHDHGMFDISSGNQGDWTALNGSGTPTQITSGHAAFLSDPAFNSGSNQVTDLQMDFGGGSIAGQGIRTSSTSGTSGASGTGATGAATPGTDNQLSTTQSIIPSHIGLTYIVRII